MSGTNSLLAGGYYNLSDFFTTGGTLFAILGGNTQSFSSSSAGNQVEANAALTFTSLGVNLQTNNSTSQTPTYHFNKNGTNGNLTISTGGLGAGWFEDLTHSDSVAATDVYALSFTCNSNVPDSKTAAHCATINFASPLQMLTFAPNSNISYTSATTFFTPISGGSTTAAAGETTLTGASRQVLRIAGTLKNFTSHFANNAATTTLRVVKNGSNGNEVISVGASAVGQVIDTTHTDSIAANDDAAYSITTTSASLAFDNSMSVAFASATSAHPQFTGQTNQTTTIGAAAYQGLGGNFGTRTTEADVQIHAPYACTASFLQNHITTNSASSTNVYRFRRANGNGNQLLSIVNGATGTTVDATHTDSIAQHDQLNYGVTSWSGTGTWATDWAGIVLDDGSINPNTNVSAVGVAATGVARAPTAGESVTLAHAAGTGAAHALTIATGHAVLTGAHATGVAHSLTAGVSAAPAGAQAHGAVHPAGAPLQAPSAHGTAHAGSFTIRTAWNAVQAGAFGLAGKVQVFATPIAYFPAARIMRNTPVPAQGAMSDTPVPVVARLYPAGRVPRSLEVTLTGAQARGAAHGIASTFNVNVPLTGVSSTGTPGIVAAI